MTKYWNSNVYKLGVNKGNVFFPFLSLFFSYPFLFLVYFSFSFICLVHHFYFFLLFYSNFIFSVIFIQRTSFLTLVAGIWHIVGTYLLLVAIWGCKSLSDWNMLKLRSTEAHPGAPLNQIITGLIMNSLVKITWLKENFTEDFII